MTANEQVVDEVRAELKAWQQAWKILAPWVESCRGIGSWELLTVMDHALAEVEEAVERAERKLRQLEQRR